MKLAIDAMGGDNAPQVNVDGAVQALSKMDFLKKLFLVGDEAVLKKQCDAAGIGSNVYITRLRNHFKSDPDVEIESIRGIGYKLNC